MGTGIRRGEQSPGQAGLTGISWGFIPSVGGDVVGRVLLHISVPCEAQAVGTPRRKQGWVRSQHRVNQHWWSICWGRSSEEITAHEVHVHGRRRVNQ